MKKSGIPVVVYTVIFSVCIVASIVGLVFINTQKNFSSISNNILSWFFILLAINFLNLLFTFRHYESQKQKKGPKGEKGEPGTKGLPGESIQCGSICGSQGRNNCPDDEKDADGNCIITGGYLDENNVNRNDEDMIQQGRCIFPFVYNYTNQYEPLKPTNDNGIEHPDWDNNDTSVPKGGEKYGVCATSLNENKTPKTWGFVVNSSARAREMSASNRKGFEDEKRLETNSGILDIKLVSGDTSSETKCPEGYTKLEGDLNQGAGAYVYMCKKEGVGTEGIVDMNVIEGDGSCKDTFQENTDIEQITKLDMNLNKDTKIDENNPKDLYLCLLKGNKNYVTDIKINEQENWNKNENKHYRHINGDVNEDTGGFPVFIYATNRQMELEPLTTAFYLHKEDTLYFVKETARDLGDKTVYDEIYYAYDINKNDVVSNMGAVLGNTAPVRPEAILSLDNNSIYMFKGTLVYEIVYENNTPVLAKGFPTQISNIFPGIPNNIDAAFQDNDGTIYIFKDEDIYEFTLHRRQSTDTKSIGSLSPESPQRIDNVFIGAPSFVDAVFTLPENKEQIYFVRGNQYWVTKDFTIGGTYPKNIDERLPGLKITKGILNTQSQSQNENQKNIKENFSLNGSMSFEDIISHSLSDKDVSNVSPNSLKLPDMSAFN